jgi:hypothetical protein
MGSKGEGGRDELTEEEAAAVKAVIDDPSFDKEELVLTGGDWFNTTLSRQQKITKKLRKNLQPE